MRLFLRTTPSPTSSLMLPSEHDLLEHILYSKQKPNIVDPRTSWIKPDPMYKSISPARRTGRPVPGVEEREGGLLPLLSARGERGRFLLQQLLHQHRAGVRRRCRLRFRQVGPEQISRGLYV